MAIDDDDDLRFFLARKLDDEDEIDKTGEDVHYSMSPELAEGRLIQPEGAILGGGPGQVFTYASVPEYLKVLLHSGKSC